jgi:hypothetical protein
MFSISFLSGLYSWIPGSAIFSGICTRKAMGSGMLFYYLDSNAVKKSDGVRHVILLFGQQCSGQRWDQVKTPIKTGRR